MTNEPRRLAFICKHKDHEKDGVYPRVFATSAEAKVPECPSGHGKMELQPNRPYNGKPVA